MLKLTYMIKDQCWEQQKMAKRKALMGVNNFVKQTKKKRPGRHNKNYNKRVPNRSKNRGQGK